MAFFDESVQVSAPPRQRPPRRTLIGYGALAVAMVSLFLLSLLPSGYVVEMPGPVYNTLGTAKGADGADIPLIEIDGKAGEASKGALMMTTVSVRGNREHRLSWLEVATSWFDPTKAVMPIDLVYPPDVSSEKQQQADAQAMMTSQDLAKLAAASELGYTRVAVASEPSAGAPAFGLLKKDDVILAVDGKEVKTSAEVVSLTQQSGGKAMALQIRRGTTEQTVTIAPKQTRDEQTGENVWRMGLTISNVGELPVPVTLQVDHVGGPSAGMMFSLGIIDKLTPGDLTGGKQIAGTGTIDPAGNVGPIGGIRHKMRGAYDAGAKYFLAPAANCNEVVGNIPDGLTVVRTSSLDESLREVKAIASGTGVDKLPTCSTK